MTLLSFIIPCYRSEFTIRSVVNEIIETVHQRDGYDYEIICVNDCSPDGVYAVISELAMEDDKIKVVNLAKNSGKQAAVLAGRKFARGDYVVTLDDDMQSPTTELWRLIEPLEQDLCDVATSRYKKKKETWWKRIGSSLNNIVVAILLDKPRELQFGNFAASKRFVSEQTIKYDNPFPYLEGLTLQVTRRILPVDMEERKRGDDKKSGYTFFKSLSLFANGMTAFSVVPLRLSSYIGIIAALLGFVSGIVIVIRKIVNPAILGGYTSTISLLLFLGGLILMSLGMLGEYVGRIYICINKVPQYVIRNTINIENQYGHLINDEAIQEMVF